MPRLPAEPQPMILMRRRFPAAVAQYVDIESVKLGTKLHPGELRRHVFDFADGLRLIVSREDWGARGKVIHVSASSEHGSPLFKLLAASVDLAGAAASIGTFIYGVKRKFRGLSGRDAALTLDSISHEMGVPHLYCSVDEWEAAERATA